MLSDEQCDTVRAAAVLLRKAEKRIRILRTVAWDPEVQRRFFAAGARELPVVSYHPPRIKLSLAAIDEARKLTTGVEVVDDWIERQATAIESGARMLAAAGTPEFLRHSSDLYGTPTTPIADRKSTALDLARQLSATVDGLAHVDLGGKDDVQYDADELARRMTVAVVRAFGKRAPEIEVVEHLSANAVAGSRRIRIRRAARFSDRDVAQLIQHEALVHIATSLNGKLQRSLPVLAAGHPGTTRTQEGLAVFAEMITGSLEPARLRRLADRVLAVQMAIEGGDFLDVYRFGLERTGSREDAFELGRRVFRGGVVSGGAPFTKDIVYLDGLLRVHDFLRTAVASGRADMLRILFCGKLAFEDVPALSHLAVAGLCRKPRYLPPWVQDLRFLVSYLAYSAFLRGTDFDGASSATAHIVDESPHAEEQLCG